jgi:predicted enzyme related to lactoylglutathione lyase
MPEVATFTPGAPVWVDVSTSDLEGAKAFYSRLFGWEPHVTEDPQAGGYTMFTLNGKQVAAASPTQSADQPTAWMVYFGTEDADATARRVEEAGGKVVAPPFDVLAAGRMAVFQDPTGAVFTVWQAGEHAGAEVVQEPSAFAWTELSTRGIDQAKAFYRRVFGWDDKTSPMGEGQPPYTEWQLGGKSIGGGMEMTPDMPAQMPPFWLNYFSAADVDATASRAAELGGQVMMPPSDFPGGRFAVLQDPQGAAFGVLAMSR